MAIENVDFEDSGKVIKVIIDGKKKEIAVQNIIKKPSTITINQLKNTALHDDIIVDATLSPVQKGILTISLWDINKTTLYHKGNVSSADGHFVYNIPNNVSVGKYIVTVEYAGNKYYERYTTDKQIEIQRRELFCDLDSKIFFVKPGETFTKTFKLVDRLNGKYISDCEISYLYKDETFNIFTDNGGNVNITVQVPNTDESHCTTNKVIYPIVFYLKESDSYLLKDTIIKLIIDKIDTEITAGQIKDNNTGLQYIKGGVISENGYVNYGTVEISMLNVPIATGIDVDSNGAFETTPIDVKDIIEKLTSDIDNDKIYKSPTDIPTTLTLESTQETVKIKKENINIIATVKDNKGRFVTDGIVDFEMRNSNGTVVYRYIDELDDVGQTSFVFYPSKAGEYKIHAEYSSVITYRPSTNKDDIKITVEE